MCSIVGATVTVHQFFCILHVYESWLPFYHIFLRLLSEISLFHKLIYDITPGSILIG